MRKQVAVCLRQGPAPHAARGCVAALSDARTSESRRGQVPGRRHGIGRPSFAARLLGRPYVLPEAIAARNSPFVLALPIFDSNSSIASVGESGVSTLRSTHTR